MTEMNQYRSVLSNLYLKREISSNLPSDFKFSRVYDVNVSKRVFFLHIEDKVSKKIPVLVFKSDESFEEAIFRLRRFLRKKTNPEDRVLPFECENEYGVYCFSTEQGLIDSRSR